MLFIHKLYQNGVCPIPDYAAEVCAFFEFPKINNIQNGAAKSNWGMQHYAPNQSIQVDAD